MQKKLIVMSFFNRKVNLKNNAELITYAIKNELM